MKKKTFEIVVKPIDIKKGIPGAYKSCPIARAVNRRFKTYGAAVSGFTIQVKDYEFSLPERVKIFIANFDYPETRKQVKPFTFRVSI